MKEFIKNASSFDEIKELFKIQDGTFVDNEKDYTVSNIISMWESGLLQEKLKSLGKFDMATLIDEVNMNQTVGNICRDIFKIILNGESHSSSTHYETSKESESGSSWLDYYLNHDTY